MYGEIKNTGKTRAKKVSPDTYLPDALSFTEVASRITEEMTAYTGGAFRIMNIKVANFAEVHPF